VLKTRRLGAEGEEAHAHAVEESRGACRKDLVNGADDGCADDRGNDGPELDEEAVDPLERLDVCLDAGLCHFAIDVVAEVATDSADRSAVVCSADGHDDEEPAETAAQDSDEPGGQTSKDDDARVVVPIAKELVVQLAFEHGLVVDQTF
jgi:hypothetical protein